ncbi:hypothetical protein HYW20_03405 [Candidatus Woesearchaeota archaeon]|nr:hypothetical protein [Candidatus Woesearchaeota archaeon]
MPNQRQPLENLSRRDFLKYGVELGGGALASILMPPAAISQVKLSFFEALNGDDKSKQQFIDQIVAGKQPEYVISVKYATPEILKEIKARLDYGPPAGTYAEVFPVALNYEKEFIQPAPTNQIGRGVKSKVFVYSGAFVDLLKLNASIHRFFPTPEAVQRLYDDHEIVIGSELTVNSFSQAEYFHKGVPGYPLELFKAMKGGVNYELYNLIIGMLSSSKAYKNLISHPRYGLSIYITSFVEGIRHVSRGYDELLSSKVADVEPALAKRLLKDFGSKKFFPEPQQYKKS